MGEAEPRTGPGGHYAFAERVRRFLYYEGWNIGVVDQPAADIVERGIVSPVRWLPALPAATALADPACRQRADGGWTLYAEHLDYRHPVGAIWSAELKCGVDPVEARFRPLLTCDFHMSYPFPIEDDQSRSLLTAETWEAGGALLWQEGETISRVGTLMGNRAVVDPTVWRGPDRWWLFCTFRDDDPDRHLHIFHAPQLCEPWTPHPRNPVKRDIGSSRPAGPIFRAGNLLVRPAQDCSRTYGGGVVLQAITRLDEHEFEERELRRLPALPGDYPHGLHTFCPAGDVTLIDGKRWKLDLPALLRKQLRRFPERRRTRENSWAPWLAAQARWHRPGDAGSRTLYARLRMRGLGGRSSALNPG